MTPLPPTLDVALKEWDIVCRALGDGRQVLLLRKGGIYEAASGFEVEHPQFFFFPTFVHQKLESLKPDAHAGFTPHAAEPDRITLALVGQVTDVIQLKNRRQMDELDDQHIWTPPLIDMRFHYRPDNPLYLLLIRTYRLPRSVTVNNTPAYAGCKSWVPLEQTIPTAGAVPVLNDTDFQTRRQLIRARLEQEWTGF